MPSFCEHQKNGEKIYVVLNFPRMIYGGKATLASSAPNLNICKIFYLLYKQLKPLAYFYCRKYLPNRVGFSRQRRIREFDESTLNHIKPIPFSFYSIFSRKIFTRLRPELTRFTSEIKKKISKFQQTHQKHPA